MEDRLREIRERLRRKVREADGEWRVENSVLDVALGDLRALLTEIDRLRSEVADE